MIIVGIGSRSTPPKALDQLRQLGALCRELGIWVRSGHAPGADHAWEEGARDRTIVYLPWPGFQHSQPLLTPHVVSLPPKKGPNPYKAPHVWAVMRGNDLIEELHPVEFISGASRQFHLRNSFQVLGSSQHPDPVAAVVCWAPPEGKGGVEGGTGQAVRIARSKLIPVFNLAQGEHVASDVEIWLRRAAKTL